MVSDQPQTFTRYLASKRTVDDRALNAHVWQRFAHTVRRLNDDRSAPVRMLELGAGIGTMIERLLAAGLLHNAEYIAIDASAENIELAAERLRQQAAADGRSAAVAPHAPGTGPAYAIELAPDRASTVRLMTADAFDYLAGKAAAVDVLLAHAFLDLVNLPRILEAIRPALAPDALLYFTINFDGATILEPTIDPALDELIERLYHATMDSRLVDGRNSGDSRTGRHLYHSLLNAGYEVLAAGASDWVVGPMPDGYPDDEAFFLHFIVDTIAGALEDNPALDRAVFAQWITERHRQIDQHRLVFIAHQLDYLARPRAQRGAPA